LQEFWQFAGLEHSGVCQEERGKEKQLLLPIYLGRLETPFPNNLESIILQ